MLLWVTHFLIKTQARICEKCLSQIMTWNVHNQLSLRDS